MKKLAKKLLVALLCVCLAQNASDSVFSLQATVSAKSVKKGLKKEGKYYYYYKNGKKIKNQWKTIKVKNSSGKKVSYRYYFGKNGKAYAAPNMQSSGYTKNVVLKKIGKYYYGFDSQGHMVKSGYYNNPNKFNSNGDTVTYYFNKNGRYNASKSKAIQKAGAYGKSAAKIRKILGTPTQTVELNSCYGEEGTDYKLVYKNVYVTIHRYPDQSEMVFGIFPM